MFAANSVAEAWTYQTRGYLSTKVTSYTEGKERNMGQLSKAQLEQITDFQSNLSSLIQLRWTSSSLDFDLSKKSKSSKKENFSVYLGENYLKYKSENWVAQLGYQEVVWGEAFGFNYADIINPKDLKQTFFSDTPESRLPLLLANIKTFFSIGDLSGSFQLLYSPEPSFSKTLPIDVYVGNLFPDQTLSLIKEKNPNIFETSEVGGKFSASYNGLDLGFFTYSYLDREPTYSLLSANINSLTINETHNRIRSSGFSFAKTLSDYVLRSDVVYTQDKTYNYILNSQLKNFSTNSLNSLISLDSPTYNNFSGVLVFANSSLSSNMANAFRAQKEQFLIGKISKNLGSEKTLELSYIHELDQTGHSLQTFLNWPINNSTDLKIGGEFYFGNELSHLNKLKNISSAFFSIKNYFQL